MPSFSENPTMRAAINSSEAVRQQDLAAAQALADAQAFTAAQAARIPPDPRYSPSLGPADIARQIQAAEIRFYQRLYAAAVLNGVSPAQYLTALAELDARPA